MFKGRSFLVKMVKDDETGNQEEVNVGDEIKSHFERHKVAYIAGAVGTGIGIAGFTCLIMRGHYTSVPRVLESGVPRVPDGPAKVTVSPLSLFSNRMTNVNNVVTVIEREGRGHPGYLVKCLETGERFVSQNHAAAEKGITPAALSQHLNGLREHAGGLHFERIGETL